MDLNDVLYIIEGTLEISWRPAGPAGEIFAEAVLYDKTHDPCKLQGPGLKPAPDSPWKYATAQARGEDEQTAVEALVKRLAGAVLGFDLPVMWASSTQWIRIPPTLIAGTPTFRTAQH